MIVGFDPNRRRQNALPSTTTRSALASSSAGVIKRPIAGFARRSPKKSPVTTAPESASGSPSLVRTGPQPPYAAIALNVVLSFRHSMNSAGDSHSGVLRPLAR